MTLATPGSAAAAVAPPVEWSYNPWRERPALAGTAVAFAVLFCTVVISLGESWVLCAGLAIACVSALSPLFTPTRCRVGEDDVARHGPLGWARRPWRDVRRARLTGGGLLVSPYAEPHWLDVHRALFLPLPRAATGPLATAIQSRLSDHGFAR
jgi:hypothetical protein